MPFTWVLLLLLFAWFAKRARKKNIAISLAIAISYVCSCPYLVNQALLAWEIAPVPIKETPNYDVGIVLSGPVNNFKLPKDRVHIGRGGDRFLHAAMLYREGKNQTYHYYRRT